MIPCLHKFNAALAEALAISCHTGSPEGASAECGMASPRPSATTCDVPAVPRNWQPPPEEAQALQPARRASCSDNSPLAKRAPMVCTLPLSSPSFAGSVAPPGTSTVALSCCAAKAIMVAGSPLSQLATPMTAFASGRSGSGGASPLRRHYGTAANQTSPLYPESVRRTDRKHTRHRVGRGSL